MLIVNRGGDSSAFSFFRQSCNEKKNIFQGNPPYVAGENR